MSLLRSDEKFYGLTGIFNYPKAMPSEGWVGWVEPKIEHNGNKILSNGIYFCFDNTQCEATVLVTHQEQDVAIISIMLPWDWFLI